MQCSVIGVAGAVAGHLEELVVVLRSIVQSPGDTPPVDIWERPANISNIGTQWDFYKHSLAYWGTGHKVRDFRKTVASAISDKLGVTLMQIHFSVSLEYRERPMSDFWLPMNFKLKLPQAPEFTTIPSLTFHPHPSLPWQVGCQAHYLFVQV